jgi:hypothetical protein
MKKCAAIIALIFPVLMLAQDRGNLPYPDSGNVNLSLDEYNKLVDLASKVAAKPEAPPIPYSVKHADLKLRVSGNSIIGKVQCDGEVFLKGTVKASLTSSMIILNARQAGKQLPIEQDGGMHAVVLSGPAEFSVELDAGMPLNVEAGRASFTLPVPTAGSARLTLEIPVEHANAKITPGIITRSATENGRTVVEAALIPGQRTSIEWAVREMIAPAAPRELRFLSDVRTLASLSETDLRIAVLADIGVVQGEPSQFEVEIPSGFEVSKVSGDSLESEQKESGRLILKIKGSAKRHQFLISMEKPIRSDAVDVPFLNFKGAQRETGEVLIEGEGTMELKATEGGALKRMDLKEANAYLRYLARNPIFAAFRYHRQPGVAPTLNLAWKRFPDSSVLAAAVDRAEITTLVTSEGRSLTEVKLFVENQAQPFLKVGLPSGAILSADVAGEKVKPVQGADGMRVPLLRPGFRPYSRYPVTFVFMHEGAPFAKKGDSELSLPKMDIPISLMKWEVLLPEMYKVKNFSGDALSADLLSPKSREAVFGADSSSGRADVAETNTRGSGVSGLSAANVNVQKDGVTANNVRWANNIVTFQQRVSGVLPIRIDVPRAGNSYQFVRPLVLDEETRVTFKYKSK